MMQTKTARLSGQEAVRPIGFETGADLSDSELSHANGQSSTVESWHSVRDVFVVGKQGARSFKFWRKTKTSSVSPPIPNH